MYGISLNFLVDWSSQGPFLVGWSRASVNKSKGRTKQFLCVDFGPPIGERAKQAWQFTLNVDSVDRTPTTRKTNEIFIVSNKRLNEERAKEHSPGLALLWHNGSPFEAYQHGVVPQHCTFSQVPPHAIVLRADGAEEYHNALTWVRETTSLECHEKDSYFKFLRGYIYNLDFLFPDRALINERIALGWGFKVSLFTYVRKQGLIEVSPSRALTQIRANWIRTEEPTPSLTCFEAAYLAKLQDENSILREMGIKHEAGANIGAVAASAAAAAASAAPPSGSASGRKLPADYTLNDLESNVVPPFSEMNAYSGTNINLSTRVDEFQDLPQQAMAGTPQPPPLLSPDDRALCSLLRALEREAKNIVEVRNSPLRASAGRLNWLLITSGQLGGWRHMGEYFDDEAKYMEKYHGARRHGHAPAAKSAAAAASVAESPVVTSSKGRIELLEKTAQDILRHTIIRSKWVLEIEKKTKCGNGQTVRRVLSVLLRDHVWMENIDGFSKSTEDAIRALKSMNHEKFVRYRNLQSQSIEFPHSDLVKLCIEKAGFVFSPMMIKRDRFICRHCTGEVSGLRSWHNPLLFFHDWSKRHPFAPPPSTLVPASARQHSRFKPLHR